MEIAIIGSGISGLLTAALLRRDHSITLFEAQKRIGGHAHTHELSVDSRRYAVDTGFIVYNERNYPNFTALLDLLRVETQASWMSFSVHDEEANFAYGTSSLNAFFAQREHLLSPNYYRFLFEVLRFNREAFEAEPQLDPATTLQQFLDHGRYSKKLIRHFILPLGSALWSAPHQKILRFSALFFIRFLKNHGMLSYFRQPRWRTIHGGSQRYVEALAAPFRDRIHLNTPIRRVWRGKRRVTLETARGSRVDFDHVIFATHSDQALRILQDTDASEREILGAIPYQANEVVLHRDHRLLPRQRSVWSSWNYRANDDPAKPATLTYHMNRLQNLDAPVEFCVTLNQGSRIRPEKIDRKLRYHHPSFSAAGFAAQRRFEEINDGRRTHFCGAYWGNGFHEDGARSALRVAEYFGKDLTDL